jgi:uncharacterized protein
MWKLLTPDLRVESLLDLEPRRLAGLGVEALLLDLDCTLKSYRAPVVPPEIVACVGRLQAAGLRLAVASNGRARRVRPVAESLGMPFVCGACKPLPFRLRGIVRELKFDPSRTALVGDQVFADVVAARLAGLRSILVTPMAPDEEPWPTRLKRPLERMVLRRLAPPERRRDATGARRDE